MISDKLKQQTKGRWKPILMTMGIPEDVLNGEHQPCPFCGGTDRFRFTDFEGEGFWFCNQCGNGTGFDLAAKFLNKSFAEVCSEIEKIMGKGVPPLTTWDSNVRTAEKNAVNKIWEDSIPLVVGDPVCSYLANRGLSRGTKTLRFHKGVFDGYTGKRIPSMIAPIHDCLEKMIGIHITHLEPTEETSASGWKVWRKSTLAKAPKKQRKLVKTISGGSIRLFKMDPTHLGIAEGIETALAVKEIYGVPCWSVMNATGMEKFYLPVPRPLRLTIYADRDMNFTGLKAAFTLANRLVVKDHFVNVSVERPMVIGDFLDQLNANVLRKKVDQELV